MEEREYEQAERLAEIQRETAISAARSAMTQGRIIERDGKRLCIDCLDEIGADRLRVTPHAGRCTSCQEDHELLIRKGAA